MFGPVAATESHPGAASMGFAGLAEQIAETPIPVYALGGLTRSDLPAAESAGAHGVAMMRAAWP